MGMAAAVLAAPRYFWPAAGILLSHGVVSTPLLPSGLGPASRLGGAARGPAAAATATAKNPKRLVPQAGATTRCLQPVPAVAPRWPRPRQGWPKAGQGVPRAPRDSPAQPARPGPLGPRAGESRCRAPRSALRARSAPARYSLRSKLIFTRGALAGRSPTAATAPRRAPPGSASTPTAPGPPQRAPGHLGPPPHWARRTRTPEGPKARPEASSARSARSAARRPGKAPRPAAGVT